MPDDEYIEDVSKITGLPNLNDIRKWRDIVDQAQGGSDTELCGLKADKDGNLLGVFRKKNQPET